MRKYLLSVSLVLSCSLSYAQLHKIDTTFRKELIQRKENHYQKMMLSEKLKTPNQEKYDIKYYSLDLTPDPADSVLSGVVEVVGEVVATTLDRVELNFWDGMSITDVYASHSPTVRLGYHHNNDILTIVLEETYTQGEQFSFVIAYFGRPQDSYYFSFSFNIYDGKPMIWTMSEPFGARAWWPCKDVPSDKADSVDIWVTVPSDLIVASNGTLRAKNTKSGKTTYWWHEEYPIVTYLVSLAIHPFTVTYDDYLYNNDSDTMKIHFYMFPDHADKLSELNSMVKDMLAFFSDIFGEYPFIKEKYGHADFLWGGAMEHQTCTSFGFWGEWVYAHELAHQWWGDMITCNSFHHIWLNEGFATYSEALWFEHAYSHIYGPGLASFYQMQANLYLGPGTVYVEDPENENIFHGGLSYNKGSWVLHMLRHVVGDSVFFDILKTYFLLPEHQYGTATTEDFQVVCEQVSGIDLDTFFQQWIYESYFPSYATIWRQFQDSVLILIQQTQETGTIFKMPIDIQVICADTSFIYVVENSRSDQLYSIPIPSGQLVSDIVIDPDNWLLKQVVLPPVPEVVVVPSYVEPESEGIEIIVDFNNVTPFPVTDVSAAITRYDSTFVDTILLYDDGNHGDSKPDDMILGGFMTVGSGEYTYLVDVFAVDSIGLEYNYIDIARFTTIGPVVYDGIRFLTDTIPNPGDNLIFQVSLKNESQTATAQDIGVEFTTESTSTLVYEKIGTPKYGDIPAGEVVTTRKGAYILEINENYPAGSTVTIHISILSEDYFFWSDSFTVNISKPIGITDEEELMPRIYTLHQNYPNPFNPFTTVKYDLPERSEVLLTIYNILGRNVRTLVQGMEEPGYKSVVWDGTDDSGRPVSAGVYLYQIRARLPATHIVGQAGDFTQTRKMLLLR